MKWDKSRIIIDKSIDDESYHALKFFAKSYDWTSIGKQLLEWNKNDKPFIIDSHSLLDQESYEALLDLRDCFGHTQLGDLLKKWSEYTAYDFAAYYIGDEV